MIRRAKCASINLGCLRGAWLVATQNLQVECLWHSSKAAGAPARRRRMLAAIDWLERCVYRSVVSIRAGPGRLATVTDAQACRKTSSRTVPARGRLLRTRATLPVSACSSRPAFIQDVGRPGRVVAELSPQMLHEGADSLQSWRISESYVDTRPAFER